MITLVVPQSVESIQDLTCSLGHNISSRFDEECNFFRMPSRLSWLLHQEGVKSREAPQGSSLSILSLVRTPSAT